MKRYDTGGGWSTESAHGKWVLYEDSRELVAVLQVAHEMEVKNLKAEIDALKAENAALHAECDQLTEMLAPQQPMSAEEVTETGIFKGLADSIWIMGAQFGWECCEANDKDRFNHAINTQDFPIAVQVPLKAPEV